MIRSQPPISQKDETKWDEFYRDRLRSLLSVDDAFSGIYDLLEKQGRSENTYFIYTSDHGLHIGQFRLSPCKRTVYETDVRMPFYISGPGIAPNTVLDNLVGIPDIAPTVLTLASTTVPQRMDGRSFAHVVAPQSAEVPAGYKPRDAWLIEYYATTIKGVNQAGTHTKDVGNNTFIALRMNTTNPTYTTVGGGELLYAEYTDITDWSFKMTGPGTYYELYDLKGDPSQLTNLYPSAGASLKKALHERLRKEWACQGTDGAQACDSSDVESLLV